MTPNSRPKTKPEQILVADGDGGKEHAISVDDLDINGLGIAGQVHDTIGHEPDEETARSQYEHQPDDAEQVRK